MSRIDEIPSHKLHSDMVYDIYPTSLVNQYVLFNFICIIYDLFNYFTIIKKKSIKLFT
jgi:hypothetical protein